MKVDPLAQVNFSLMRRIFLLFLFLPAGCRTTQPEAPPVRPVKVVVAADASVIDKDFAGLATPDDAVNLAFKVGGQVLDIPVSRGEQVARGALLAELDPKEIRLQVDAERSAYEQASSQLNRMRRLLAHEAISVQEFEAARTRYAQARSSYENAADLLSQTKLRAPFAGVIEDKYVDTYQRVTAGQTILRIVNPRTTTVSFTLPESALYAIEQPSTAYRVRFDNYRGASFRAVLKDYARTSSDASGFPVSLTLVDYDAERYPVSPGMSCTITMQTADTVSGAVSLPLSAIYAPAEGGTYVWIVGDGGRVRRQRVRLGELFARDRVVVDSGVVAGDTVVSAGVYRLVENERVDILK